MANGGFFSRLGGATARDEGTAGGPVGAKGEARQRLDLLESFERLDIGWFWATDGQGRVIYLSESAAKSLGTSAEAITGKPLSSLFSPDRSDDPERAERPLHFLISARNSFADLPARIALNKSPDGDNEEGQELEIWWSLTGKPQFDEGGHFQGYRGAAKNITAERERQRDATRLAKFDALTGLANRHSMEKRLGSLLTAYKAAKRSCALFMLDLDRFKQVNDTLGHPAGDELLKQVAQRLKNIIGGQGEIGRLGGDEFQVILPDIDDRGRLGELAQRVIQMLSQPYSLDGRRAIIGSSVGIAIAPYDGVVAEELVSGADLALYSAKGGGRGQYRFYSSDLKAGARLRKQIEEDLRDAMLQDQLELHYQPVVRAKNEQAVACEALMRWNHPDNGWISPGLFIPIAEETGLIAELGEWALLRACRDAKEWPGSIRVSVNVLAVQFANADFPRIVQRVLSATGLEASRLELELTESIFLADPHATRRMFKKLKQIGVRLALDDFGTGYSSLGYLRDAPFDKIKIDQSFVRGATEDGNNNAAIMSAIVSLAQALKMETVAEGVEALDELELVTGKGVELIQGYVFAKAMSHADLMERIGSGAQAFAPVGPAKHRAERMTVFRKVGVIHEDHRYDVVLRNLSRTGAMIEGLLNVPKGTKLVLDLGEGQLAVSTVRRSREAVQGLEFETPLISDGADGLCTRHRISPYALAAVGMPLAALPPGHYPLIKQPDAKTVPTFMQLDLSKLNGKTGSF